MGLAKGELMEQQEKKTCINCNSFVEKQKGGWYCHKCKTLFSNACEECSNVFNPKDKGDFACEECMERASERLE